MPLLSYGGIPQQIVCAGECPLEGPPVGALIPVCLSARPCLYPPSPSAALLVALHDPGYAVIYHDLPDGCPGKVPPQSACWTASPFPCLSSSMVPHHCGLRDRASSFSWAHGHLHHSRRLLTLCPYLASNLLWRRAHFWFSTSSGCTASKVTLCQTRVRSSPTRCGDLFFLCTGGCSDRMVNTHSPTVRWREQTRLSRACCGAWSPAILAPEGPTPWYLLPLVCLPFWPLLFEFQEDEVAVHSMQANLRHCRRVWKQVWAALLCSSLLSQRHADRCRAPVLSYCTGQKVGLSRRDLLLQVEARKLALWFVGPFRD